MSGILRLYKVNGIFFINWRPISRIAEPDPHEKEMILCVDGEDPSKAKAEARKIAIKNIGLPREALETLV